MIDNITKIPPQNKDAEMGVLGSMLLEKDAIDVAREKLLPIHFYEEAHGLIYKTMLDLNSKDIPVDLISLSNELKKRKLMEDIGGSIYLTEIMDTVITSANVEGYVNIVHEKATLRSLIRESNAVIQNCFDGGDVSSGKALKTAGEKIQQLISIKDHEKSRIVNITSEDFAYRYMDMLEERKKKFSKGPEFPTGIAELDRMTWGLARGFVWLIGARVSLGKTSLAINIALNLIEKNHRILLLTTESAPEDIYDRVLSTKLEIDGFNLRKGNLNEFESKNIVDNIKKLFNKYIFVCDIPSPTIQDVEMAIKEVNPDVFIIDYLDRMTLPSAETDASAISSVMKDIKTFSRDYNCAALVLSQLSREVDKRTKEIPKLSDFKGSAGKEENSDTALMISIAEIAKDDYVGQEKESQGIIRQIIWLAKQRNGPTGSVDVEFVKKYTKFRGINDD